MIWLSCINILLGMLNSLFRISLSGYHEHNDSNEHNEPTHSSIG